MKVSGGTAFLSLLVCGLAACGESPDGAAGPTAESNADRWSAATGVRVLARPYAAVRLAVDLGPEGNVYWGNYRANTIETIAKTGAQAQDTLVHEDWGIGDLIADESRLYWFARSDPDHWDVNPGNYVRFAGTIRFVDRAMPGSIQNVSMQPVNWERGRLAVDKSSLYWTDFDGMALWMAPKTTGQGQVLAKIYAEPWLLATSGPAGDGNLFWVQYAPQPEEWQLAKAWRDTAGKLSSWGIVRSTGGDVIHCLRIGSGDRIYWSISAGANTAALRTMLEGSGVEDIADRTGSNENQFVVVGQTAYYLRVEARYDAPSAHVVPVVKLLVKEVNPDLEREVWSSSGELGVGALATDGVSVFWTTYNLYTESTQNTPVFAYTPP
jgi:hypothetical protein